MYNSITEEKIKAIPNIGDIDITRLPQELTRIYAKIVSLRRQVVEGTINFQEENLVTGLILLRSLSSNLETILLSNAHHEKKEAIAFVAGTANSLMYKMGQIDEDDKYLLEANTIASSIAATILFLIGNSQADSAEMAVAISNSKIDNLTQLRLINSIVSLATGKLTQIANKTYSEEDVILRDDYQQTALNYLWRELDLGVVQMAKKLVGKPNLEQINHFDRVIDLSESESGLFNQKSVLSGPYRLAKLLRILEDDIFKRAVIDIPPPIGVDSILWQTFLEKLVKDRPYLWENHKAAVSTDFLNPGVSAILTLPTGAGKSTLTELKIASCLYSGKRAIYLVPTHALEEQVNRNLRLLFVEFEPNNFEFGGEYTDFGEIDSFPILVMTPERCLTLLNIDSAIFESVGLVVFDEFHLIHGVDIKKDRRSIDAMYCLLSLFTVASHADFVLISAMVENGNEIASWITQITGRKCNIFSSTWKPTRQLHGCVVFEESKIAELKNLISLSKISSKTSTPPTKLKKQLFIEPLCFFSLKNVWETDEDDDYFKSSILNYNITLGINKWWQLTSNRNKVAAHLAIHFANIGLKTLVFVDDPRIAKSTSRNIAEALQERENNYEEFLIKHESLFTSLSFELGSIEHSYFCEDRNVGVHHGLLLNIERTLIESYFKDNNGSIVLVATGTLAQGINLPAEIVIIAGDDRFDEDGNNRQRVNPHELMNAAGRAGRAGLSSQGAVILIPGEIVTIQDSTISERWWQLKNEVFSKGDQCLKVEDPLQYFLDSLQENSEKLSIDETNILYRFKPEKLSDTETKIFLSKSFYGYKASQNGSTEKFNEQVNLLLKKRDELDKSPDEKMWYKEIGVKLGIEPMVLYELGNAIYNENFEVILSKSITELIDWYFNWLLSFPHNFGKIFTKQSTINQIKKAIGLKEEVSVEEIIPKLNVLSEILKNYVQGVPLNKLNDLIPNVNGPDNTGFLFKARSFNNRLVPELSFGFGILSLVILEIANQKGIDKLKISWDIRALASCIREGFDSAKKLFYKKNNKLLLRVETHLKYVE